MSIKLMSIKFTFTLYCNKYLPDKLKVNIVFPELAIIFICELIVEKLIVEVEVEDGSLKLDIPEKFAKLPDEGPCGPGINIVPFKLLYVLHFNA